jgi:hypothetical protein
MVENGRLYVEMSISFTRDSAGEAAAGEFDSSAQICYIALRYNISASFLGPQSDLWGRVCRRSGARSIVKDFYIRKLQHSHSFWLGRRKLSRPLSGASE